MKGHGPWDCEAQTTPKSNGNQNGERTYAEAAGSRVTVNAPLNLDKTPAQELWKEILTPNNTMKTPMKGMEIVTYNPYELLYTEEPQEPNETGNIQEGIMKPLKASTPKPERRASRKRKTVSTSSNERTSQEERKLVDNS